MTVSQVNIEPITDKTKMESASSLVANFKDGSRHLKLSFMRSRNWIVVPVESGCHFIPEDAELMSLALHSIQCFECLAIATEDLGKDSMCYRVSTSKAGLLDFSYECGHFNFALTTENLPFVVLCMVADYYLVAGQADFVTKAVGKSIQASRSEFFDFADKGWKNNDVREFLLDVYQRYEPFNGE